MSEINCYEKFRTVLAMNLCTITQDTSVLNDILRMVDFTMSDYEISKKQLDIIPASMPTEVVQCFLVSKAIANLSKNTLKQYGYKLKHFFDTVRKSYLDITTNDIRIYLANFKIQRNASNCYMESVRVTINGFFQWLVNNNYLQYNPCANIEKIKFIAKRRESLTTLNLEDLRWNCINAREKALVDFMYSTGCRVSECSDVLLSDVNWEQNTVYIRNGKGGKDRIVRFNDESKVSLKAYLKTRQDHNPALWVSSKKPYQQIQPHALENIIKKIGERSGLRVYPHKLRHTFATIGLRNGIPLDKLQTLMGHSSPKTTLIYADQDRTQVQMEHLKAFS